MNKGFVGKQAQNGIKRLVAGTTVKGKLYQYELKVFGEYSNYLIYGNKNADRIMIFDYLQKHYISIEMERNMDTKELKDWIIKYDVETKLNKYFKEAFNSLNRNVSELFSYLEINIKLTLFVKRYIIDIQIIYLSDRVYC